MGSKFQDRSLCAFTLNYKPGKLLCAVLEHVEWSHDGLKRCTNGLKQCANGLKQCCNGENLGSIKSIGLCPIPYTYAVFPVLIDVIVFICTACRMATELLSTIYSQKKRSSSKLNAFHLASMKGHAEIVHELLNAPIIPSGSQPAAAKTCRVSFNV